MSVLPKMITTGDWPNSVGPRKIRAVLPEISHYSPLLYCCIKRQQELISFVPVMGSRASYNIGLRDDSKVDAHR